MKDFSGFKKANYGEKICAQTEGGVVCFDPDSMKKVVGTEKMTYDEYLDAQIRSLGQYRSYFEMCYFNFAMGFQGQIERITNNYVCFERIFVSGMFSDGDMFEGKEDHVWLDKYGFESFQVGDCVEFSAEVYRYVKTGNGKLIDYSLRKPEGIKRIESYQFPSDDKLLKQEINRIICETCFFSKQCNKTFCMLNPKERKSHQRQMFKMITQNDET